MAISCARPRGELVSASSALYSSASLGHQRHRAWAIRRLWLRGRVFSHRTGSAAVRSNGTGAEALINIRQWGAIQLEREEFPGTGWGPDRDSAAIHKDSAAIHGKRGHAAGGAGVCLTAAPWGGLRMVRANHLIAEAIRATWRRLR